MKKLYLCLCLFFLPWIAYSHPHAHPEPDASTSNAEVLKGFNQGQDELSEIVAISDQRKREVMFFMGVPLLILLLITGGLGIAMGVYGKQVFVQHMVLAGLSMTLAIAHAVVGIVWFYPF